MTIPALEVFKKGSGFYSDLAVSESGQDVTVIRRPKSGGLLQCWRIGDTQKPVWQIDQNARCLAYLVGSKRIAAAVAHKVIIIDAATAAVTTELRFDRNILSLAAHHSDPNRLFVGLERDRIADVDIEAVVQHAAYRTGDATAINRLAVSPTEGVLAAGFQRLAVFDDTGDESNGSEPQAQIDFSFLRTSEVIWVGSEAFYSTLKHAVLWNRTSDTKRTVGGAFQTAAFDSTRQLLACVTRDRVLRLYSRAGDDFDECGVYDLDADCAPPAAKRKSKSAPGRVAFLPNRPCLVVFGKRARQVEVRDLSALLKSPLASADNGR